MEEYYEYGVASEEWLGMQPGQSSAAAPEQQTILELQEATNSGREAAAARLISSKNLTSKVSWTDISITSRDGSTIPGRVYRPSHIPPTERLPVYLFFHGGGFMFGTINSEDYNCAQIVSMVPVILVHICYRHTPIFKHPTQVNDAHDGFEWVVSHAEELGGDASKIIVGGVSAGGSLAASVVLRENQRSPGKGRITGQLLAIPWLYHPDNWKDQMESGHGSYFQNKDAPILPITQVQRFTDNLGIDNTQDETLFPGHAKDSDLTGMPKTLVLVAGMDVLRDEGLLYEKRLRNNGVKTQLHVFSGLPHGFYRHAELPSADTWFQKMATGIQWMLDSSMR